MSDRSFLLPENLGRVVFKPDVLQHMYSQIQSNYWSREAGGQLFSPNPHELEVLITSASGSNSLDIRRRHGFNPNVAQAMLDREDQFSAGRHAVGLWHTHPEAIPFPSIADQKTAQNYLAAFEGIMTGFLLVILGNQGMPPNMAVWMAISHGARWMEIPEIHLLPGPA